MSRRRQRSVVTAVIRPLAVLLALGVAAAIVLVPRATGAAALGECALAAEAIEDVDPDTEAPAVGAACAGQAPQPDASVPRLTAATAALGSPPPVPPPER
jgi:hypothetical protein